MRRAIAATIGRAMDERGMGMEYGDATAFTAVCAATVACCLAGFVREVRHGVRALPKQTAITRPGQLSVRDADPSAFGRWT